jgi:hypothetical protein
MCPFQRVSDIHNLNAVFKDLHFVIKRGCPRKTCMEGVRAAMKTRHLEADQWLNRKDWCLGSGRRRQLSQDRKDG